MTDAGDRTARFGLLRVSGATQLAVAAAEVTHTTGSGTVLNTVAVELSNVGALNVFFRIGGSTTVTTTNGGVLRPGESKWRDVPRGTVLRFIGAGAGPTTVIVDEYAVES